MIGDLKVDLNDPDAPHPRGLYVLFATEMWERFSFYSMLSLFTLYLQDTTGQGFAWTKEQATVLYANYMMCVYASPLVGGLLADRKLGHRRAVMIGGFFFMAGHLLLSFRSVVAVYAALTCLVIGNGLFKPNVSTMVGSLYPDASPLKDRAYNIFYMGINIGAFLAPIVMELVKSSVGYHPAFAVAAFGMVISVGILWRFESDVNPGAHLASAEKAGAKTSDSTEVPEWRRVGALIVIYTVVIVFWMVFHQNGSTLTYWADENTAWEVSGTISGAINPFWVLSLTPPLVLLWKRLGERGLEPSTPAKMCIGMFLTGFSFFILYAAARSGESTPPVLEAVKPTAPGKPYRVGKVELGEADHALYVKRMEEAAREATASGASVRDVLLRMKDSEANPVVKRALTSTAYHYRVSPGWLITSYGVVTLGELMLSPMGLSLVSKVAPAPIRALMMGGWFVATAIGNKLTQIGIYWEVWSHSRFFATLGSMAVAVGVLLIFLLPPLKRAMPNV